MLKLDRTDAPATDEYATVYVAIELSKAKWKLGILLPGRGKLSRYTIDGGVEVGRRSSNFPDPSDENGSLFRFMLYNRWAF